MCYHKQDVAMEQELWAHYQAMMKSESYLATYYENGFDFKPSPVLTVEKPKEFTFMKWGLVPWWTKSSTDARQIRLRTLNCISEEMYDKSSFRDSAKEGKRCLIPCTGFFEWRWFNNGKNKYPYFIHIKSEKIFSIAGLHSSWTDKSSGEEVNTYAVLTTKANALMEKIHNSKKRMPVILMKDIEKDWLNPSLTKEDVLAICAEPLADDALEAYTISKMITDRKVDNKDVAGITKPFDYPELALLDA